MPVIPVARLISGISAATAVRQVGTEAAPVVGPANRQFAAWGVTVNVSKGDVVGAVTTALKNGDVVPAIEKLVTDPPPPPPPPVAVH